MHTGVKALEARGITFLLDLELQAVVNLLTNVLGIKLGSSGRVACTSLLTHLSLQDENAIFKLDLKI